MSSHTDFNDFNQLHFIFIFCWEFLVDKSRHNCDQNAGVFKHVTTTSYYDQEILTFLMRAILPFYIPPPINLHIAQESKSCFKMWLGFSSFLLLSYNNYLIQKIHLKNRQFVTAILQCKCFVDTAIYNDTVLVI